MCEASSKHFCLVLVLECRSQRTMPPNFSADPPSPSMSSQSSQSSGESSYSPSKGASPSTKGRLRRSLRTRSEDSDITMSSENSPSMLTGRRNGDNNKLPSPLPEGDDMSHDHNDMSHDGDDASSPYDHLDESQAGSASPEDILSPLSPLTTTVPETPTRTSFLRKNGTKDLLSMSTEEYFSAQEDVGEGAGEKFDKRYNADLGGSICSDSMEDVIATNIAVKTDEDDNDEDGFFMGQASTDDSDIEQGDYSDIASTPEEIETQKESDAANLSSTRLSPVTPDDLSRVQQCEEGSKKVQRKGRQERGSIKLPPLSASTTLPLSIKTVLDKEVKVVVPKLSHKSLSQELSKFKSPGLGEKQTTTEQWKSSVKSDSEYLDVEASQRVDMEVPEATPEGSGDDSHIRKDRRSKLKRRKGKPRAEFKVKTEPLSQRFVEDSSSGSGTTGTIRASSSPDDITFSDVAYNAIGDSPPDAPPESATHPCSDDLGGSSNGDTQPDPSPKPKRKFLPLKDLKHVSSSQHRSRSSSVTSNPRTPLLSQLHDEDKDFDEKSPYFQPSRGTQRATPTPKKSTPLKKKKKVLVTISSDEEDEKPILSSKKTRKVKKERGVDPGGPSQDKGESTSRKILDFGGDGDIFTFDSDDDGAALGGRGTGGKSKARVNDWIDHLDEEDDDGNIGAGEGTSSGLNAVEEDGSLASDFDIGKGTSTPIKDKESSKSNGLGGGGESSSVRRKTGNQSHEGTRSSSKPTPLAKVKSENRVTRSSLPPVRSPLEVNIALKSPLKLGKHAKGPHNKGKEKARPLPRTIQCLACGREINWKNQKVHAHPRLNVITCQVSPKEIFFSIFFPLPPNFFWYCFWGYGK